MTAIRNSFPPAVGQPWQYPEGRRVKQQRRAPPNALRIPRLRFVNEETKRRPVAHADSLGQVTSNIPESSGHPCIELAGTRPRGGEWLTVVRHQHISPLPAGRPAPAASRERWASRNPSAPPGLRAPRSHTKTSEKPTVTRIHHASWHYPRSNDRQASASLTKTDKRDRTPAHDTSSSFEGLPRRTDKRRNPECAHAPKRQRVSVANGRDAASHPSTSHPQRRERMTAEAPKRQRPEQELPTRPAKRARHDRSDAIRSEAGREGPARVSTHERHDRHSKPDERRRASALLPPRPTPEEQASFRKQHARARKLNDDESDLLWSIASDAISRHDASKALRLLERPAVDFMDTLACFANFVRAVSTLLESAGRLGLPERDIHQLEKSGRSRRARSIAFATTWISTTNALPASWPACATAGRKRSLCKAPAAWLWRGYSRASACVTGRVFSTPGSGAATLCSDGT